MAKPQDNFISWLALFISVLALILAWTGRTSLTRVDNQLNQLQETTNSRDLDRLYADTAQGVRNITGSLQSQTGNIDLADDLTELRSRLALSYGESGEDVNFEWRKVDAQLEELQNQAASGAENFISLLQQYLAQLESNLEQPEES